MSRLPSHITLSEAEGRIDCATCRMGMDAPPSFGGIPRADLIASFIVQHADHNARGFPNGLTASGRPTKRAVAALRADQ